MPNILVNDLKELKEYNKKHQYMFTNKYFVFGDTSPLHPDVLRRNKNEIAELAGVKQIRIHDFRHSCTSLLINSDANVTLVAKFLGHTKIEKTLNTYSHMFSNSLDSVVYVIDSLEDN